MDTVAQKMKEMFDEFSILNTRVTESIEWWKSQSLRLHQGGVFSPSYVPESELIDQAEILAKKWLSEVQAWSKEIASLRRNARNIQLLADRKVEMQLPFVISASFAHVDAWAAKLGGEPYSWEDSED